jgi:hypothetical protein
MFEVREATVLQIGGCRITIEPDVGDAGAMSAHRRANSSYSNNPAEWRIAEAELQRKTNAPFELATECKTERLEMAPREGGKYHSIRGDDVQIARVIGTDGSLWFVVDVNGRPVALKLFDLKWHALPRHNAPPRVGDLVIHEDGESAISEVYGEAEVGGWCVSSDRGVRLHVVRASPNAGASRWMSFGTVELEK